MTDTRYTLEQFNAEIDEQFAKHDVNADGKLDHAEFEAYVRDVHSKYGKNEWNQDAFEAVFKHVDTDNDGFISKDEVHAYYLAAARKTGRLDE